MEALWIEEVELHGEDGGRIFVSSDHRGADQLKAGIVLRLASDGERGMARLDDEETLQLRAMIEAQIPHRKFGEKGVAFEAPDGTRLSIHPSNMGEPYREGLKVVFGTERGPFVMVFIQDHEVLRLAEAIDRLAPGAGAAPRM